MNYTIQADAASILGVTGALEAELYPRVQQAVAAVAAEVEYRWKHEVMAARLWDVERQHYLESIEIVATGRLSVRVESSYALAAEIETGRPARDLKGVLPTSKRARRVKTGPRAGQLYLIVPFRHNVPGPTGKGALAAQMPTHIYAAAKALTASRILPPGSVNPPTRKSATGHTVPQQSYSWGGRLPAGMAPKAKPHHVTDLYAGMTRFDTSSGAQKSSAYLTFRTMGAWSPNWIVAPRPGLFLAKTVADSMSGIFEAVIQEALARGR